MKTFTIRKLDNKVLDALTALAKKKGQSREEFARRLLEETAASAKKETKEQEGDPGGKYLELAIQTVDAESEFILRDLTPEQVAQLTIKIERPDPASWIRFQDAWGSWAIKASAIIYYRVTARKTPSRHPTKIL